MVEDDPFTRGSASPEPVPVPDGESIDFGDGGEPSEVDSGLESTRAHPYDDPPPAARRRRMIGLVVFVVLFAAAAAVAGYSFGSSAGRSLRSGDERLGDNEKLASVPVAKGSLAVKLTRCEQRPDDRVAIEATITNKSAPAGSYVAVVTFAAGDDPESAIPYEDEFEITAGGSTSIDILTLPLDPSSTLSTCEVVEFRHLPGGRSPVNFP